MCSEQQHEVFYLQDELAEMICAHPQETYCAAHVRFNEYKDSSSFFEVSKCAHVPSRNPAVCSTQTM